MKRRTNGEGTIYRNKSRNRFEGQVTVGIKSDGKTIRLKVTVRSAFLMSAPEICAPGLIVNPFTIRLDSVALGDSVVVVVARRADKTNKTDNNFLDFVRLLDDLITSRTVTIFHETSLLCQSVGNQSIQSIALAISAGSGGSVGSADLSPDSQRARIIRRYPLYGPNE